MMFKFFFISTKLTPNQRSKVTNLFEPGSARGELPLGDGWFSHSNLRYQGEHRDGRSLRRRDEEVNHQEENTGRVNKETLGGYQTPSSMKRSATVRVEVLLNRPQLQDYFTRTVKVRIIANEMLIFSNSKQKKFFSAFVVFDQSDAEWRPTDP